MDVVKKDKIMGQNVTEQTQTDYHENLLILINMFEENKILAGGIFSETIKKSAKSKRFRVNYLTSNANIILSNLSLNIRFITISFWLLLKLLRSNNII